MPGRSITFSAGPASWDDAHHMARARNPQYSAFFITSSLCVVVQHMLNHGAPGQYVASARFIFKFKV